MKNTLPDADQNIVGKSRIDKNVMASDDWLRAKGGDFNAADRIVDSLWSEKKTAQLKKLIGDTKNKVFVTMPSTSGYNVLPGAMARKLAIEFEGKMHVIQGDKFFNLSHNVEVKTISRFDRVFFERQYNTEKIFDKSLEGKKAVLIDDIFTTGGSAKAFANELSRNKLAVTNVVGLMGDKRFNVDEKTEYRLKTALKNSGIKINSNELKDLLTRTEAGMLIQRLNRGKGIGSEQNRELAERIQRLKNGVFTRDIRGNQKTGGNASPEKSYNHHAADVARLQDRSSRGEGKIAYRITVEFPNQEPIHTNLAIADSKDLKAKVTKASKEFACHQALRLNLKPNDIGQTVIKAEKISMEKQPELQKKFSIPSKGLSK